MADTDPGYPYENVKLELKPQRSALLEMEFQASQVIERLEEAAERAAEKTAEGSKESPTGLAWKSSHPVLSPPSKSNSEILKVLEDLMTFEDSSNLADWSHTAGENQDNVPSSQLSPLLPSIPNLDSVSKLALVSQSLAALASTMDRTHSLQLSSRLANDCSRWLGHMFRFPESSALFHDDFLEGLVRIVRLMLHYKYPKYQEDGFEALTAAPPVIYSSSASSLGFIQALCRQLGLPLRCVRPVPCNTMFGSQQKMDVAELERLVELDKTNKHIPLIVLADAGTIIAGHVDNLARIQEICGKHDIWLHVRGHSLAALPLVSLSYQPQKPTKIADSFSLPIGTWLGIPALPIVTLYQSSRISEPNTSSDSRERELPLLAGLVNDSSVRRLVSLPLWTSLQALGREGIQSRIARAFESCEMVWKAVSNFPSLRLLSPEPGGEAGAYSISEILGKQISPLVVLDVVACTVVFQFLNGEETVKVPPYYDKLNTWLGHTLQQECPPVVIDLCEMESHGVVLRYCPLELSLDNLPTRDEVNQFSVCLEQQLEVLTATVQLKEVFQQSVSQCAHLQLVQDMADWAGLGGVRYVPDGWELLNAAQRFEELNRLNIQLVDRLQSTDQAFSLGEDSEGMAYVRFGMVTAGSDVEELLELVLSVGKEVEESSRFLETMSLVVKKGIEAATLDLQKENEERLWQEGILRQVPVVGSFVNWWSPRNKEGGIKGRSLNLNAGVVESTENIYRYHMQLQGGTSAGGTQGLRVTPTPMVQTPVGTVSGSQHSRSSSQASQVSQTTLTPPPVSLTSSVIAPANVVVPGLNSYTVPVIDSATVHQPTISSQPSLPSTAEPSTSLPASTTSTGV